jgi:hypothetical protein
MQLNSRKTLSLLIVLAIALLPFRFGHASEGGGKESHGHSLWSHVGMGDCNHDESTMSFHDCDGSSPNGHALDDCCEDHCSGAQSFVLSTFELNFSASQSFGPLSSPWLPEPLSVAEFRPPITIS